MWDTVYAAIDPSDENERDHIRGITGNERRRLRMKVLRGKALAPKDYKAAGGLATSDPYCAIYVDNVFHGATRFISKSLDPVWSDESATFEIDLQTDSTVRPAAIVVVGGGGGGRSCVVCRVCDARPLAVSSCVCGVGSRVRDAAARASGRSRRSPPGGGGGVSGRAARPLGARSRARGGVCVSFAPRIIVLLLPARADASGRPVAVPRRRRVTSSILGVYTVCGRTPHGARR